MLVSPHIAAWEPSRRTYILPLLFGKSERIWVTGGARFEEVASKRGVSKNCVCARIMCGALTAGRSEASEKLNSDNQLGIRVRRRLHMFSQ